MNSATNIPELIRKCVPRYEEMFFNLFHYLPDGFYTQHILDLGCGTGNLTAAALQHFPQAQLHALDVSGEILRECANRFAGKANVHYHQQDFNFLDFPDASFDLIISAIAIHHITDPEKVKLYARLHALLKPGGIFVLWTKPASATTEIYNKHIARWQQEAFKLGSTQQNWDMWMQHQTAHDYHDPTVYSTHSARQVLRMLMLSGRILCECDNGEGAR